MRRVPSRVGSWALVCVGVVLAAQQGASGQTLTPLRDYVGWTSTELDLWVGDVTPDFGVMVGSTYPSIGPIEEIIYARQPIRWTSETGTVQLPLPPGLTGGAAWKVSDDGSIVTIEAWGPPLDFSGNRRFYVCRWSEVTGTVVLLDLSNTENAMFFRNVSGDGRTLIGSVDASIYGYRPFRWTSEQGLQFLRPITGDWIAWAQLVNRDASIVVGYDESAESGLFRWTPTDGMAPLPVIPHWSQPGFVRMGSNPMVMSADGDTIYGIVAEVWPESDQVRTDVFRWTSQAGTQVFPLDRADSRYITLEGLTTDEAWLFGVVVSETRKYASLWRSDGSRVDLDAYFRAQGQSPTWDLFTVNFMSDVHRLTIGQGELGALGYAQWIAALPVTFPCDAIDFNNDGSAFDPADVDALFSVFSEGPCVPASATCNDIDFNNDGSVFDPCDIASFLTVFSEGPCTACGI